MNSHKCMIWGYHFKGMDCLQPDCYLLYCNFLFLSLLSWFISDPPPAASNSSSSYPYPPTVSDESLPNPGNVRSAIQTFERKISIDEQPENRQRKYRNAVNYWQALGDQGKNSSQLESHLGGKAENVDRSLMRLAQERRSVRERKTTPQRPKDLPLRMRSSQEELDKIASRNHSRENSFEGDYRSRGQWFWSKSTHFVKLCWFISFLFVGH